MIREFELLGEAAESAEAARLMNRFRAPGAGPLSQLTPGLPAVRGNGRMGGIGQPRRAGRRGAGLRKTESPSAPTAQSRRQNGRLWRVHGGRIGKLDCRA
jgi:hypothetical protein